MAATFNIVQSIYKNVYAYGVFVFRVQGVTAAAVDDSYFLFQ